MKGRSKNFILAIIISTVLIALIVVGYQFLDIPGFKRILQIAGGFMPSGIIQYITYIFFFWGLFEIAQQSSWIKRERKSFSLNLLPEKEHWVLSPDDVNELKMKMIEQEKSEKFLLTDIVKKGATKFRSNNSTSEVLDVVSNQIKLKSQKSEGSQSVIRYLAWAMPSIGFIGTILGIAKALGLADQASDPEVLGQITSNMYVAFDTTLVALILSVIMMWFYHVLQEDQDNFLTDLEDYTIENFVNRIHIQ